MSATFCTAAHVLPHRKLRRSSTSISPVSEAELRRPSQNAKQVPFEEMINAGMR